MSLPPRPSVVMSKSSEAPWKPATITIRPAASSCSILAVSMPAMRARPKTASVRIPACTPLRLIASLPSSCSAIESSVEETASPVENSMSSSRGRGLLVTSFASAISRSVVSPIAETTATTRSPPAARSAMRRATCVMRSASATELPPYFWTTSAPLGSLNWLLPYCPSAVSTSAPPVRSAQTRVEASTPRAAAATRIAPAISSKRSVARAAIVGPPPER